MSEFSHIELEITDRVAIAVIDNPPVNVITRALFEDLVRLADRVETDDAVGVLVVKSANVDFFIAHYDVASILRAPVDGPPNPDAPNGFHALCERFRTMPKVSIAQIEGRVGGGGSELAASMDMRFGVRNRTRINQMEVPLGILPGGTGTQRLPRLLGRGRALELILGGDDLDAETAVQWGYLNRAFYADQIDTFVRALSLRIAKFPAASIALAKEAVLASDPPLESGLALERLNFQKTLRTDDAQRRMQQFLDLGGQQPDGERDIDKLVLQLD